MPVLYMGLDQVKDLTQRTQARIIQHRPFPSLDDFLSRVDPREQEVGKPGEGGRFGGIWQRYLSCSARVEKGGWKPGQMSLFGWDETSTE